MSGKKDVMAHDPLAEIESDLAEDEGLQTKQSAGDVLDLELSLTIAEVGEWHAKFLSQCDLGEPLILKGGDIETVDGAGLQLLAALMKEAAERQLMVTWLSASDQLKQATDSVGLIGALGLDDISVGSL